MTLTSQVSKRVACSNMLGVKWCLLPYQTCFLSSPLTNVIVFIDLHFSHLAPKSDIFQKAWGVRKFGSPHFLHVYTTIL
jgi:hypothetical protein